jgi:hypothetical protein
MIQNDVGRHLIETYSFVDCCHRNKDRNTRVAVLVETRDAFFLPLVIKNFCLLLGDDWNFHLFINERVEQFLSKELPHFQYHLTRIHENKILPGQYSFLLRQREFWEGIREETILIFQGDCLLLRPIPLWAEQYDMIGAPCGVVHNNRCVFNGGFSIRKRTAMLEMALTDGGQNQKETRPEDVFFTEELWKQQHIYKLPDVQTAFQFATESVYSTHCIGIHGTDKYYS